LSCHSLVGSFKIEFFFFLLVAIKFDGGVVMGADSWTPASG
jgi:hypothetical protein